MPSAPDTQMIGTACIDIKVTETLIFYDLDFDCARTSNGAVRTVLRRLECCTVMSGCCPEISNARFVDA